MWRRARRANLWAGVYVGLFGPSEESADGVDDAPEDDTDGVAE